MKEDDTICREALRSGTILLYHRLAPLLQKTDSGIYSLPLLQTTEVEGILKKLGKDPELVKESILITCNEHNQPLFSLDTGDLDQCTVEELCGGTFIDLRKAFFLLRGPDAPLVARGQALLRWHQSNRFCSATGKPTERNQSGSHRTCYSSGITYYPKMAPVAIVLVSDGKRCLLGRQTSFPRGMYSALAGFCDMGETMEETVRREIAEEVGLEVESISYSGSQHWPFPQSSFMVAVHAMVNPDRSQVSVDHVELEDARWFTLEEITSALKIRNPPRSQEPPLLWVPPSYAIANRLIREWAANHQH